MLTYPYKEVDTLLACPQGFGRPVRNSPGPLTVSLGCPLGLYSSDIQNSDLLRSLSAPSLDCLCIAEENLWSCSINSNRTRNLSLLLPWTVSARQASLPAQLVYPFTRPFCYSCFSVKSYSPVLLGPYFAPSAKVCISVLQYLVLLFN